MKKILVFVLMLVCTAFAVTAGQLSINSPIAQVSGEPDATASVTFTVNNGIGNIASVTITSTDLTSGTNTISRPTIASISLAENATNQPVTFSVTIPENMPAGIYTGKIKVEEYGNTSNFDEESYSISVISKAKIEFVGLTEIQLYAEPAGDSEKDIKVRNTGNVDLTNLEFEIVSSSKVAGENIIRVDDEDLTFKFNPATTATLIQGAEREVTIGIDVDRKFDIGTQDLDIRAKSQGYPNLGQIDTKVNIEPLVCDYGEIGELDISIDQPDSGDEFSAGDKIHVSVDVENNDDSDDITTKVKAILYDEDDAKVLDEYSPSSKKIQDGHDTTFEFDLEMETSPDKDNTYTIYVKAYEGDEDEHCTIASLSIDAEETEDLLRIESFTLSPLTANPGDSVSVMLILENLGTDDQDDVVVKLTNSDLKLNYEGSPLTIEGVDNDDIARKTEKTTFKVPADAKEGSYEIKAVVTYADGLVVDATQTLNVEKPKPLEIQPVDKALTGGVSQVVPITGGATSNLEPKGILDIFKTGEAIPSAAWILLDVLLVALIVLAVVAIFRRNR